MRKGMERRKVDMLGEALGLMGKGGHIRKAWHGAFFVW